MGIRAVRWVWIVVVVALLFWGFTDVRRRSDLDPQNPGKHETDLTVYTGAGAAFYDGRPPYTVTNPRGLRYLYPPLFALLIAPLHRLPADWQGVTWFLVNLLMAWGCLRECRKIVSRIGKAIALRQPGARGNLPGWIAVAAIAAVFFPFFDTLQRGQAGIAVLLPLLAGVRIMLEAQGPFSWFLGGFTLAFPVVLKVTPALPVSILLLQQLVAAVRAGRPPIAVRRFVCSLGGLTAGLLFFALLLPAALVGWDDNIGHLRTWYTDVATNARLGETHNFEMQSASNQNLKNAVHRLSIWLEEKSERRPDQGTLFQTPEPADAPIIRVSLVVLRALLVLLLLVVAARWHWDSDSVFRTAAFGLACGIALALSPISWAHHFVMLLPGTLLLPWAFDKTAPSLARWLAVLPAAASVAHYTTRELASSIAGQLGLLGIGIAVWCFVAAVGLVRAKPVDSSDEDPLSL